MMEGGIRLGINLDGKVVFVIGGHSGIGLGTARAFASRGATVVIGYGHSKERAMSARDKIDAVGGLTYVEYCDVTDESLIREAFSHVTATLGSIDIVVNAAGATQFIPFDDFNAVTGEIWNGILATNLIGSWNVAKVARPALEDSRIGNLVFVGSIAGIRPSGSSIPYAVSKAGLHHLVRVLARAFGPSVRVNAVAPGTIDTPWMVGHEEMLSYARSHALLQRTGSVEDIAEAIFYLGTSPYTTGEILVVDGGLSLA